MQISEAGKDTGGEWQWIRHYYYLFISSNLEIVAVMAGRMDCQRRFKDMNCGSLKEKTLACGPATEERQGQDSGNSKGGWSGRTHGAAQRAGTNRSEDVRGELGQLSAERG